MYNIHTEQALWYLTDCISTVTAAGSR